MALQLLVAKVITDISTIALVHINKAAHNIISLSHEHKSTHLVNQTLRSQDSSHPVVMTEIVLQ